MEVLRKMGRFVLVRSVLGTEVYKDTKTGREYVILMGKSGKVVWKPIRKRKVKKRKKR